MSCYGCVEPSWTLNYVATIVIFVSTITKYTPKVTCHHQRSIISWWQGEEETVLSQITERTAAPSSNNATAKKVLKDGG